MKITIEIPDEIVAGKVTAVIKELIPKLEAHIEEGVRLAVMDLRLTVSTAIREKAKAAIWTALRAAINRAFALKRNRR